jgi:tRNA-splicing ligase RtcB
VTDPPLTSLTVRGDVDDRAVRQLERCASAGDAVKAVLCADGHVGYSQPIGGAIAYPGHISPSGVGFDIACLAAGAPVSTADGYSQPIERVRSADPVTCWDGSGTRRVSPNVGAVERGLRPTLRIVLANGRELLATADHRIRTDLGWRRADDLREGDAVACTPFVGLPFEPVAGHLDIGTPRAAVRERLERLGLFPLQVNDVRFPALLRILGYCMGDGHLHTDGTGISLYTVVPEDAAALTEDFVRLGFDPHLYVRARDRWKAEHCVRVRSIACHHLLATLGCPLGSKIRGWKRPALEWIFGLPAWARAHLLSAFASAEATTPALVSGRMPNLAIKQAGETGEAIGFVTDLISSLGFRVGVTESGPARGAVRTHVAQVLGGEAEGLRFLEQVGFCRAVEKRVAAAHVASVVWQRRVVQERRADAVAAARSAPRDMPIRQLTQVLAERHGVSRSFIHHAIFSGRGAPRTPKGGRFDADHSNEAAWVPVAEVSDGPITPVYDIVTGDPAESFQANGIAVHNCGNKAVRTDVLAADVDVPRVMDEVERRISFGVGRKNQEPVDHPVLEEIGRAEFAPQRRLEGLAADQLGTVGGGNHYVDLFEGDDGHVWVGVHFGSRGFGHRTASGFLAMAQGLAFDERATEGAMDAPPVLFAIDSEIGQAYVAAMELAGRYAYAGRDVVVDRVLEILGARATKEVHNHHNFAWRERHFGEDVWVIRKGCTPAFPGQEGFVGATMGEDSVVLAGVESDAARDLLRSTVHGAGRVMSRREAAGKMRKGRVVKPGRIDWAAARDELRQRGIELRGGAADEAPGAYKRLDTVLAAHADTIEVRHRLRPIGVAMAAAGVFDPYKD